MFLPPRVRSTRPISRHALRPSPHHPPNKPPRSTPFNGPRRIIRHAHRPSPHNPHAQLRSTTLHSYCKKTETNLSEDILVSVYYVRWSCVRNLLIVRTGGLPPSLRSGRLRPERQVLQERLALQVLQEHAYDSNGNISTTRSAALKSAIICLTWHRKSW